MPSRVEFAEDIFVVRGILTLEECRSLIERAENLGFEPAAVRTRSGPQMRPDIRNNDRIAFSDSNLAGVLWERIHPYVPHQFEGGIAIALDDNFRFYRYDQGQQFNRHRDGVTERSSSVRSRLSCLFYLADGFTGGETVLFSETSNNGVRDELATIVPQSGDALLFRHEIWHEGRSVLDGRKYVLRTDVFYEFPS